MKKYITLFVLIFLAGKSFAQNETDALNLSQYFAGGTARGLSMAGAYGALGGDFTSLSINPAGIGVYRSSEFVFTPSLLFNKEKADYNGTTYTDNKTRFGFSNIGFVLNSTSNKEEGWISASFGFGYNKLIDFNKNITIKGFNSSSSFLDEAAYHANYNYKNGQSLDDFPQLAVDAGAIYYEDSIGKYINDNYYDGYAQHQIQTIQKEGNVGEYVLSFGANYSNKLFIGATLGLQSINYKNTFIHDEYSDSSILNEFVYDEDFRLHGSGINLKLGIIYKPLEFLRLGLALHTPTYYALTREYYCEMATYFIKSYSGYNGYKGYNYNDLDFTLNSPLKVVLSGALQSKIGLLSVDYEYVDYTEASINTDDNVYNSNINQNIQDYYRSTSNLKIGGELKLENFSLRAGYGFYGSPYNSNTFNKSADTYTYSAGFGIRGENSYIDFAYIAFVKKYKYELYYTETEDVLANIEQKTNKFVVTVGFKF